ncbi:MAG: 50S ribosomal protein L35 [Firmicutes bacterium]|nr:50S ribosomal protein L35 [Bacillota bacterium]
MHYSAGGKLMHQKAGRRHNMIGKGGSWRRRIKRAGTLSPGDHGRTQPLLPYD